MSKIEQQKNVLITIIKDNIPNGEELVNGILKELNMVRVDSLSELPEEALVNMNRVN